MNNKNIFGYMYYFVAITRIMKRGALIVLEGCDRSGKTTQCRKLAQTLNKRNIIAETMSFPGKSVNELF